MDNTLLWILGSTFLISLIAFVGVLTLFLKEKLLNKILLILVSLSAGALIGGAFLHLLPEAILKTNADPEMVLNIFLYLLLGFCLFFVLEQFIRWHHHHGCHSEECNIKPFSYLILISDGIHNFIDGLIIAGSFVINPAVGIVTTLAVALHEIPQELGDFGVLVYGGFDKVKALFLNFISALTAVIGGICGYFLSSWIEGSAIYLLSFAAGNFIYIASSDLIPEIKHRESLKKSLTHFLVFLIGIGLMLLIKIIFAN
ncbi:MAG: zinc/iron permease [Candidatus Altiarchaeales archaeon WOR_SM1_86-2]|nr:MAG: zinc/iron permease [Candidatus Altiarchaeales archaeon WOR_SM1_86-2]ODS40266.1 MAG: zinc/iron permease [Candidatus Altiarchaeales archaeon WOR_SM1_79]